MYYIFKLGRLLQSCDLTVLQGGYSHVPFKLGEDAIIMGLGEFYTVWKLIPYIKGKNCVPPTVFSLIIKGKNCVPAHNMFPYY